MIVIAHFIAISCYVGATALAAMPFARRVQAPVRGVIALLALGATAHGIALLGMMQQLGSASLTGLGPALSFAGFLLAIVLLLVEAITRDVSLALVAAPLAAVMTTVGNISGLTPFMTLGGARAVWLVTHIVLSFSGLAFYATAAAAGAMYLVARRELKSGRFGAVYRFFPPLETLDRVNHFSAIAGFMGLTLGVILAGVYSVVYRTIAAPEMVWGLGAWLCTFVLAFGRILRGWQAKRAAVISAVTFAGVVAFYVLIRASSLGGGQFL